jgi:hypothetical protein
MARAALLDTKTQTLIELIGNGKRYLVPAYQRDYSWGQEQWEDLWTDVIELLDRPDVKHYMGALVVEAVNDREFRVIDGQQRLATLSIVSLVLVDHLQELARAGVDAVANLERATALRHRFIGEKDPASLVETSKLSLNETDDDFYQEYLVQLRPPLNPRALPQSNKLLWEGMNWFRERVSRLDFASDGARLAHLLNETVARQLLFIQITVDDDLDAYTVFETLNARRLELTVTDLLKNYLFSRAKVKPDLESLHRRWRALLSTVRQERFPDFLRYHYLTEQPKVGSARLFKLVRDQVKTAADVFRLMDILSQRSEIYAAINNENHEYWIEQPECRRPVRELNLFRAKQMTPLVMVAWERLSAPEFVKLLKLLSVLTFRHSVVCRLNTNELETVYHQAARLLGDGSATTAGELFDVLRAVYVDDVAFEQTFSRLDIDTSGQRKQLVKYILCELEGDASGRPRAFETDPGTIEHILPENASEAWEQEFTVEQWSKYVYRLGNLTLLKGPINRDIGNAPYPEKVVKYAHSGYSLTTSLIQQAPDNWNPDQVDARQAHMARRAVHIWRSAYP